MALEDNISAASQDRRHVKSFERDNLFTLGKPFAVGNTVCKTRNMMIP